MGYMLRDKPRIPKDEVIRNYHPRDTILDNNNIIIESDYEEDNEWDKD